MVNGAGLSPGRGGVSNSSRVTVIPSAADDPITDRMIRSRPSSP